MPKTVKEIVSNPFTGEFEVEYSDDSTNSFNIADVAIAKTDPLTGVIKSSRLNGVTKLFEQKGVVANGTSDDASNFQEAILAARSEWGGAMPFPTEISKIKINSGIVLDAAKDNLTCDRTVLIDASGVTSGAAITVDGSIVDGNVAAMTNIANGISRLKLIGAGSPFVVGAPGVVGIKFRGTNGKAYFYNVDRMIVDGFETNVDLAGNSFGIEFTKFNGRAAKDGTIVQCLAGDGMDYGENYRFIGGWLGNSARALYNTNSSATFKLIGVSLDYCKTMIDMRAGVADLSVCYVETNQDLDYLFKVGTNESSSINILGGEITLNVVNRTAYELFFVDSNVQFGGIAVRDTAIWHGGGYSLPSYTKGNGRAVCSGIRGFVSSPKPPFSQWMSSARQGNDANSLAEWTLTGTTPASIDATTLHNASSTIKLPAQTGACQLERTVSVGLDQNPRFSVYYHKAGSTAGQARFQVTGAWLDSKGTVIGSTATLFDIDGDTADFTSRVIAPNTPRPLGGMQYRLRLIKSADTGGTGNLWLSQFVGGAM